VKCGDAARCGGHRDRDGRFYGNCHFSGGSVRYPSTVIALQIQLEDLRQHEWRPLYVGDRPRYATATSVHLLDAHTLVCSSLLARKIYLIRFDVRSGSYTVVDGTSTLFGGSLTETDLCDADGRGRVVTSNCEGGNMSLYRVSGTKINHESDLCTTLHGNYCHGARFCGPDVVVATTLRDPRGAHFYDVQTMRRLLYVRTERLPKDICFLPGNRAVLITTDGAALSEKSDACNLSELQLIEYDLARGTSLVVDRQLCGSRQLDSATFYEGRLYIVDGHGGRILIVDARTLRQVDQIDGYDFPHGVDAKYGMLAIACYGTNSIHVRWIGADPC
jgi:hypothetical protein